MITTETAVVVHYAEIGLKGKNRGMFVNQLMRNIRQALDGRVRARVQGMYGRVMIHLDDASTAARDTVRERLQRVPGIANFSFAEAIPIPAEYATPLSDDPFYHALQRACWELLARSDAATFAVRARRAEKHFPALSLDLERDFGAYVLERARAAERPLRVDLTAPQLTCHVEIARPYAFVYGLKEAAPGGLPVGTSGKLVSLLSAGFDSPVASYMMMKRGAEVIFVHFHSHPLTTRESIDSARDLVDVLNDYQFYSKLYLIPFGFAQQEIIGVSPRELRMVLYRRMMMRIASEVARRERALGLVTGESLGQVASQTLANMAVIDVSSDFPVYRPLIGMNKAEIIDMAQRLDTREISSDQVPDCCSLMVARHPVTKAKLATVEEVERAYDVERLVRESLERADIEQWGPRGRRKESLVAPGNP